MSLSVLENQPSRNAATSKLLIVGSKEIIPFWHVHWFRNRPLFFDVGGRSALWYSDHLKMTDTRIDAPKMFREMHDIEIENVEMNDAAG